MTEPVRVLHIDDDPDFAELTAEFLEQQDGRLHVEIATTIQDGLERLEANSVDCVISDYDMPEMDGLSFLDRVKTEHPELPFILFTGKGSEEIASEAISAGVTDYLQKEIGSDHYAVLANRVLDAVDRVQSDVSYREIFDKASIGLTVRDLESGEVLDVNQRYCEMLGYEREEVLSLSLDDLTADVPGYSGELAQEKLERAKEEGSASFQWPDETKDVEVIWVQVDMTTAEIDGRDRLLVSVQDITAQTERERELTKAKRRFETVFNNPVSFMALLEPDGTVIDANESALDFIGKDLEDVVGNRFWNTEWWTHSESLQADLQDWIDRAAAGERISFEAEHKGLGDRFVVIDGELQPVTDEDGAVTSIMAAGRDISERKARERDLVQYQEAIDAVAAGVFMVDETGDFELINRRLLDLSGFDRETLEHGTLSLLMDEEARAECADIVTEPTRDEINRVEWPLQTATTGTVPCEARVTGVEFGEGRQGTIWACADVSDRLDREEELKRQNDRLERVINILSHDLRNPLMVAQGRIELARQSQDEEHLEAIASSLDRMEGMLDDTLALAKTGQRVEPTDHVELHTTVDGCWSNVDTVDATLTVESGLEVRADEAHIQNLLENLMRNAVEHGGRDVTVRLGPLEDGTGFYVEDDGEGIPVEDRDEVFESGGSSKDGNAGFGLNIVREIAEAHGWDVTLTAGPHDGARFEFTGVDVIE